MQFSLALLVAIVMCGPLVTAAGFSPCPLIEDSVQLPAWAADMTVECMTIEVPLHYTNLSSQETINVFTRRITLPASSPSPPSSHLFFVEGGPGLSVEGPDAIGGAYLAKIMPGVPVYLVDARGTGKSSFVDCPVFSPITECAAYVGRTMGWEYLSGFTVSNQARDLYEVMKASDILDDEVLVYSRSYGTYVMLRFLAIFEGVVDRVVLDGVAPPQLLKSPIMDINQNDVGSDIHALCTADPFCASQFPDHQNDAYKALYALRDAIEYGDNLCAAAFNITGPRFAQMLDSIINNWPTRPLMPALVHRMLRCSAEDKAAVAHFMGDALLDAQVESPTNPTNMSLLIASQVIISELWQPSLGNPSGNCDTVEGYSFASLVAGWVPTVYCPGIDVWQPYPLDEYYGKYPVPGQTAIFGMTGSLDPAAPFPWLVHAQTVFDKIQPGAFQSIVVPNACHTVAACSPLPGSYDPSNPLWFYEGSCGIQVATSFLTTGTANTTCVNEIIPIDWEGVTQMSKDAASQYFGVPSVWG